HSRSWGVQRVVCVSRPPGGRLAAIATPPWSELESDRAGTRTDVVAGPRRTSADAYGATHGRAGRLPLRRHVPVGVPERGVDPRRARTARPRHPLALLQPRGDQPRRGQEAPVGATVVLRVVPAPGRRAPAPPLD